MPTAPTPHRPSLNNLICEHGIEFLSSDTLSKLDKLRRRILSTEEAEVVLLWVEAVLGAALRVRVMKESRLTIEAVVIRHG